MPAAFRFALACALLWATACSEPTPGARPPHVIFVLADDLGVGDLPAYRRASGLSESYALPQIERLAREGMLFLDAHQPAAVCAPARFALLTGSNPGRGRPAWSMNDPSIFDDTGSARHHSVGRVMQAAGYRTAFIGKEHTGGPGLDANGRLTSDPQRLDPTRTTQVRTTRGDGRRVPRRVARPRGLVAHGFDVTFSLASGIQAPPYLFWRDDVFEPIAPGDPGDATRRYGPFETWAGANGESQVLLPGIGDRSWNSSQVGIRLAEEAARFIDDHVQRHEEPFLLFYSSQALHVPHTPPIDFDGDPQPLDQPVRGQTLSRKTDMVLDLDHQLGRILEALDRNGIAGDTLVFFTSDNGGHLGGPGDGAGKAREREAGYDSSGALRGGKDTPWEGGHRVPLIARWGDGTRAGSQVAPGTITRQLVTVPDWVATLYDLTGRALPRDQAMDSVSLLPLLLSHAPDDAPPVRDRALFREFDTAMPLGFGVRRDVRDEDGRLLHQWYYFEPAPGSERGRRHLGQLHLYDLLVDPAQTSNLLQGVRQGAGIANLPPAARQRYGAHEALVKELREWENRHRGPDGVPTTPRVDYTDPDRRTPLP